ncbi:MAG: phosphoglycolate phosphatase [Rhizobiaceae bacterium]|nr:phosphoglycolate phosphatase [Rhizobiaceae bacterium]
MKSKIAVFDLDGTLIHTAPDLLDALNHSLAGDGLSAVAAEGFRQALGSGGKAMIESAHRAQNRPLTPEALERMYGAFLEHYSGNIPGKSLPFPGVLDTLDQLSSAGYLLAICTNKTEALALRLIEGLGLRERFEAICGVDTFMHCKPDPRHLLETIEMANGNPSQALMVGDSRTDIDTAKAAGIPVIAVDFGYTDIHVSAFEPSLVISHYRELTVELADRLIAAGNDNRHP